MGKFVLVVVVAAVLIYLTVRVIERRGLKPTPKQSPRPLGPDDDPDFLWNLNKKTRKQKKPPPPPDPGPDDEPGDEAKPA